MNIKELWASGKVRTNRKHSTLGRIILVCVFAAAGLAGTASFALAAPTGSDSTTSSVQAMSPQEVRYLCSRKSDGVLRYVNSLSRCDAKQEKSLTLSESRPIFACASRTGEPVRRVSRLGQCSAKETALTLPDRSTVVFCAMKRGGWLRHVSNSGECPNSRRLPVVVKSIEDAPTGVDDAATVDEDSAATQINVLDNDTDPDGGTKTITSNSDPANGTVELTGGSSGAHTGLTYEPDPDYCNTPPGTTLDTFTYTLNGGSTATVSMTVDCVDEAPSITSISPSTLVPGETATLTGNFSPTAANNTVTIGGADVTVTAASATTLAVTVPCVSSGSVAVQAKVNGTDTNTLNHPLQVTQQDLDAGEAVIMDDASEVGCNELASANGDARYVVAAYNSSASPTSTAGIKLSADTTGEEPAQSATRQQQSASADIGPIDDGDDEHLELLQKNREQYKQLRERFGTDGNERSRAQRDVVAADLPETRNFRVSNVNVSNICNSFYVTSATRVYSEGKLAIYEDDATPDALKASENAAMAAYYDKIGDQFNADMEPIIRDNFGDILRRDAVTDNNGVMVALATPRLNNSFPGVAGFVVSCDQFPNDDVSTPAVGGPYNGVNSQGEAADNGASNFGEFFYLYQPTVAGTGYSSNTPDQWYRTVRSTFIHESKHVASHAAHVANDAPSLETSWLEEGTARHAEELWARQSVYNVAWKGNTGYGSAAAPNSLYCDPRPTSAACTASNPRRPSVNMQRHFASLYEFLGNPKGRSPFGRTSGDGGASFYATSWSLVRYASDRYATSDAEFLTGLTQSTSTGATNLSAQAGVSRERLLGGWSLALFADDYPGLTGASPDLQMPTWNFDNIYTGLNTDFPSNFSRTRPIQPQQLTFGSFTPISVSSIAGGGVAYFELSGTQTQAQLMRLQGNGGGELPSTVRVAVARVE